MGVHDQKIRAALTELDIDQNVFSAISGLSQTRLSQAFKGVRDFSIPEIQKLNALIDELREIARGAGPIPVAFQNVEAVRRLLEHGKSGIKWSVAVQIEDAEPTAEEPKQ
jgi:hypothetical protein